MPNNKLYRNYVKYYSDTVYQLTLFIIPCLFNPCFLYVFLMFCVILCRKLDSLGDGKFCCDGSEEDMHSIPKCSNRMTKM